MNFLQTIITPKPFPPFCSPNINQNWLLVEANLTSKLFRSRASSTCGCLKHIFPSSGHCGWSRKSFTSFAVSRGFDSETDPENDSKPKDKPKRRPRSPKPLGDRKEDEKPETVFPTTKPRKPRRGRRSEAVAVEDFVRGSLDKTFASIRQQNPEVLESNEYIMKDRDNDDIDSESDDDEEEEEDDDELEDENDIGRQKGKKKKMVVDEEGRDWPLDADVGWGIRASEYFQKHPIKNIAGEDGTEIDWEGEIDDNWVTEINCLEWESIAFHPSPLIVLAFERYNRATDNWKTLKELEKAVKVYWSAKDRLPPRSVKIDINIEKDLAYALKVKEGPQILFLRGNKIVYRERDFRTADELVQMIAHFYYNAKKPSCVNDAALSRPY